MIQLACSQQLLVYADRMASCSDLHNLSCQVVIRIDLLASSGRRGGNKAKLRSWGEGGVREGGGGGKGNGQGGKRRVESVVTCIFFKMSPGDPKGLSFLSHLNLKCPCSSMHSRSF